MDDQVQSDGGRLGARREEVEVKVKVKGIETGDS